MSSSTSYLRLFIKYCPAKAVSYCYSLWLVHPFELRVAKARKTKLGDYQYTTQDNHRISVNQNLNPYAFLITYIHEVAHLQTFVTYGQKVSPHGKEWKKAFGELMQPLLRKDVFPTEILAPLSQYMTNPKASSCTDAHLLQALHQFDTTSDRTPLLQMQEGEVFSLNGRVFKKGKVQRTRIICEEPATRKKFLIPGQALVIPVESV
jgi:hypothetical protein